MTDAQKLADEYEAGLQKCAASGYEEYGPDFQKRQQLIIKALRAYATVLSISQPDWPPHFESMKLQAQGSSGTWIGIFPAQLTEMAKHWPVRAIEPPAALAATPAVGGENDEQLWGRFVNHYWDSFEGDKEIVLKHVRAVLDYHAENSAPAAPPASPLRGTREQIAAAVRRVLDDGKWPEYRTQDDNGLKDYEYVNFIMDVFAKLSASFPEQPCPDCDATVHSSLAATPAVGGEDWSCGTCGNSVPEEWRVFGSCYKCAAQKSIDRRNRKIDQLKARLAAQPASPLREFRKALEKIASYSPASTIQPVAIAREALSASPPEQPAASHVMCIGWPTIKRLMTGEAVWFDDLQCGAVAADDLLSSPGKGVSREDIATIIREGFEAPPDNWPEREPWADGALDIADEIMRMFSIPETSPPEQPAAADEIADLRSRLAEALDQLGKVSAMLGAATAADPVGQSMDEAAANNFGLTIDDLDEGDDE